MTSYVLTNSSSLSELSRSAHRRQRGIPPGASFQITIPLCDPKRGYEAYLTEYQFLQRWSAFRFVADLDGHHYKRPFSQRQVAREIERFRRVANPLPKPAVRPRDEDKKT